MKKRGFLIIELIVVMVILGILASIAIPRFYNAKSKAGEAKMSDCANAIGKAMSYYHLINNSLPPAINVNTMDPLNEFIEVDNWLTHFKDNRLDAYWTNGTQYSIFFTDKETGKQYRLSDNHFYKKEGNKWVKLW